GVTQSLLGNSVQVVSSFILIIPVVQREVLIMKGFVLEVVHESGHIVGGDVILDPCNGSFQMLSRECCALTQSVERHARSKQICNRIGVSRIQCGVVVKHAIGMPGYPSATV